jgi:hypothetical protein
VCLLVLVNLFSMLAVTQQSDMAGPPYLLFHPLPADPYDFIRTDLADYAWPTDAGNIITSTFGEFRRTHFHAGIDISTGDYTHFPVFASRDGYVARILVNPIGYGKLLFIRHSDGYTSAYAHLEQFDAPIAARAEKEQKRLGCYPVDIRCSPVDFPVKKGQLIAYSGDTGSGSPHLHFEIRDEHMNPVNPLLCAHFLMHDNLFPTIRRVAITPLGEHSLINGKWQAQVFQAHERSAHRYVLTEPIQLTGDFGFAVDVQDRSNGSRFKSGVYSHRFLVDDSPLYSVQFDRVPGRDAHQIGLYYETELLDERRGRFEKLYMDSPNELPFYRPKGENAGIVHTSSFAEGVHTFKIISSDFNNNSSEISGRVILNHPSEFRVERAGANLKLHLSDTRSLSRVLVYSLAPGTRQWNLWRIVGNPGMDSSSLLIIPGPGQYDVIKILTENTWGTTSLPQFCYLNKPSHPSGHVKLEHDIRPEFVRMFVSTDAMFTGTPSMVVDEGTSRRVVQLQAVDINQYVGTFKPLDSFTGVRYVTTEAEVNARVLRATDEFALYPIVPRTSGTISFDDGKLQLSYDSLSVFKTVYLQIQRDPFHDEEAYLISPHRTVLHRGIAVRVRVDSPGQYKGLFFRSGRTWDFLARQGKTSQTVLNGELTRTLGDLSVRTDDTPPSIFRLSITGTATGRPTISFRFSDNLSGIEYEGLKMYIDGVAVIPEIDGEHRRTFYQAPAPLARGPHQLTIQLKDKMGNTREVERRFAVR